MKRSLLLAAISLSVFAAPPAKAQSDASAMSALSVLPLASVAMGASATAGASLAVPAMLSAAGAVFVVKAVEVSARGTIYVLERASDGARVLVEVAGASASIAAGTVVTVSVIGAGVILSAAGEVIAFVPDAMGRALLHNERLTY